MGDANAGRRRAGAALCAAVLFAAPAAGAAPGEASGTDGAAGEEALAYGPEIVPPGVDAQLAGDLAALRAKGDAIDIQEEHKRLIRSAVDQSDPADVDVLIGILEDAYPDKGDAFDDFRDLYDDEADLRAYAVAVVKRQQYAAYDPRRALVGWEGEVRFNLSGAEGNSDNKQLGLSLFSERDVGIWTHRIDGYADFAASDGVRTQKRWGLAYQVDADFGEKNFVFARVQFEEDDFSGFDYRLFGGVGLGRKLIDRDDDDWRIQAGPGYRYSPIDDTKEIQSEAAVFAASDISWEIIEDLTFTQDLRFLWTQSTSSLTHIVGLKTSLLQDFSTSVTYEIDYETNPPEGRLNLDQILKASLVYEY